MNNLKEIDIKYNLNRNISYLLNYLENEKIINKYEKILLKNLEYDYIDLKTNTNYIMIFNEILKLLDIKENLKTYEIFKKIKYNENDYYILKFKKYDMFNFLLKKLIIELLNTNKIIFYKYY